MRLVNVAFVLQHAANGAATPPTAECEPAVLTVPVQAVHVPMTILLAGELVGYWLTNERVPPCQAWSRRTNWSDNASAVL